MSMYVTQIKYLEVVYTRRIRNTGTRSVTFVGSGNSSISYLDND